jgi:hypothetical protein
MVSTDRTDSRCVSSRTGLKNYFLWSRAVKCGEKWAEPKGNNGLAYLPGPGGAGSAVGMYGIKRSSPVPDRLGNISRGGAAVKRVIKSGQSPM